MPVDPFIVPSGGWWWPSRWGADDHPGAGPGRGRASPGWGARAGLLRVAC